MSLDHLSAASPRNLTTDSHTHAPINDRDAVAVLAGVGEHFDPAHATWEAAWIDIGGEG